MAISSVKWDCGLESNTENGLVQEANQIILEPIIKRRGDDMCNTDTLNMARTSDWMRTGNKKGVLLKSTNRDVGQEGVEKSRHGS